ncbi:GNAT family N-acetyltransferase [Sulfitobacter sediminilitoris]|uniref:GNAT family N-acetyltransferase n=1 Tax=Sulfitobacter sediminilitoris TaxID=2698830 RepID=UPI001953AB3D|nr:GNAT family N-acetyltransferase [Sulfitobacter sediminilitoris]
MNINRHGQLGVGSNVIAKAFDDLKTMHAMREAWQALADADPEANVFLSWEWMHRLFSEDPSTWCVFFVRDPAALNGVSAILPLHHRFHWSKSKQLCQTRFEAAGRRGLSPLTGLLCDPAREETALRALAQRIKRERWARLTLRFEPTGQRLHALADHLNGKAYRISWPDYKTSNELVDQLRVPTVSLPTSFESYLQNSISKSTRSKLRRFRRKYLETGAYRVEQTTPANFEANVNIFKALWRLRWEGTMSKRRINDFLNRLDQFLRRCQSMDVLFMPVLWRGDRPVGSLVRVVDLSRKSMFGIAAARRLDDEMPAIGLLLNAVAIEEAIRRGLSTYELGHGTHGYKYQYGAADRELHYLVIERRGQAATDVFNRRSICGAALFARTCLADGQISPAVKALEQIETASVNFTHS